jgi:RimJ/RimL family protein N-acetyltransferase
VLRLPIETERLLLRDFEPGDRDAAHAYGSGPEVVRFLHFGPNDEAATDTFIRHVLALQQPGPRDDWTLAVVRKSDGPLIGACSLRVRDEYSGDIGYVYRREAWGQGYGSEAVRAIVDAGFEQLGLRRIWATCDARNTGSARVLEKAGMQREGHFRRDRLQRGEWRDTYFYAILADERTAT